MGNVWPLNGRLIRLRRACDIKAPTVRYVIERLLPAGMLTVLSGKDDRGKTVLALEMARAVRTNKPLFGKLGVKQGLGVALLLDDPASMIKERLDKLGIGDLPVATDLDVKRNDPVAMLKELTSLVEKHRPRLIIVDALYLCCRQAGRP